MRAAALLREGCPTASVPSASAPRARTRSAPGRSSPAAAPGPATAARARFLLSSLQSAVFNEVLARRPLPLDAVELGDVAMVCASGGCFLVEDVAAEQPRAQRFEISATGPVFGTRMTPARGAPGEREQAACAAFGVDLASFRPPPGVRARGARRPLRVRPEGLRVDAAGEGALALEFELPAGSYATVLVEELLG